MFIQPKSGILLIFIIGLSSNSQAKISDVDRSDAPNTIVNDCYLASESEKADETENSEEAEFEIVCQKGETEDADFEITCQTGKSEDAESEIVCQTGKSEANEFETLPEPDKRYDCGDEKEISKWPEHDIPDYGSSPSAKKRFFVELSLGFSELSLDSRRDAGTPCIGTCFERIESTLTLPENEIGSAYTGTGRFKIGYRITPAWSVLLGHSRWNLFNTKDDNIIIAPTAFELSARLTAPTNGGMSRYNWNENNADINIDFGISYLNLKTTYFTIPGEGIVSPGFQNTSSIVKETQNKNKITFNLAIGYVYTFSSGLYLGGEITLAGTSIDLLLPINGNIIVFDYFAIYNYLNFVTGYRF